MKNDIEHMFTSTFSTGSHPIVEINDNSFADVPVNIVDYPLNFPLQFGNRLRFVHVNL